MDNWNALVEKVEYTKDSVQTPKETDFPKNRFHLAWTGDPSMAYRTKPIQSHDYAQIAIAETLTRLNAFKISTIESSEIRFKKPGYYIVTLRISGIFDGTSVSRRIEISLLYKGKKGIEKIISHTDLMDLSELQ